MDMSSHCNITPGHKLEDVFLLCVCVCVCPSLIPSFPFFLGTDGYFVIRARIHCWYIGVLKKG